MQADDSSVVTPPTGNRRSASNAAKRSLRRNPLFGISPIPRHLRWHTSKTSRRIARAATFPSRPTERVYWFSTSPRPLSSCRTAISVPWTMSSGSNPVTTNGTR